MHLHARTHTHRPRATSGVLIVPLNCHHSQYFYTSHSLSLCESTHMHAVTLAHSFATSPPSSSLYQAGCCNGYYTLRAAHLHAGTLEGPPLPRTCPPSHLTQAGCCNGRSLELREQPGDRLLELRLDEIDGLLLTEGRDAVLPDHTVICRKSREEVRGKQAGTVPFL